jgi:hypothetical protein
VPGREAVPFPTMKRTGDVDEGEAWAFIA